MAVADDLRKSGPSHGAIKEEDCDAAEDLSPLDVPVTDHKLQHTYGLWYIGKTNYQHYDLTLQKIGRFASVEQFWSLYSHLVRPSDLHSPSDFFIFKDGIKPMWEHSGNCNGGQWVVRLNKGLAARCWENLILAVLGEQFNVGDEICGAGVSLRAKKDCISLWHKTSSDEEAADRLREGMRKVLNLPNNVQMEYRNHKDVLNWVSGRDAKDGGGGYKLRSGSPPLMERSPLAAATGDGSGHVRRDTGGAPPGMSLR